MKPLKPYTFVCPLHNGNRALLGTCLRAGDAIKPSLPRSSRRWSSSGAGELNPRGKGKAKTALFFPGQGTQRVGMLTPWLEAFPALTSRFIDETDSILNLPGLPLSRIIQEGTNRFLTATPNAQPAIFATSILILRILEQEFGFKTTDIIDVTLGHSLGEFAALVAADYLTYHSALLLLRERAEIMAAATAAADDPLPTFPPTSFPNRKRTAFTTDEPEPKYGMVAVVVEKPEHLPPFLDTINAFLSQPPTDDSSYPPAALTKTVSIANVNAKNQIVLSGYMRHIRELLTQAKQFGGHDPRFVTLSADSPFHSQLMAPAARFVRSRLKPPSPVLSWPGAFPCISNVTARPFESTSAMADLVARSCVETVRWWDSIRFLDQEYGVRRWVGIGPSKVGRNLVGKEVGFHRELDEKGDNWGRRGGGVWAVTKPADVRECLKGLESTEGLELE